MKIKITFLSLFVITGSIWAFRTQDHELPKMMSLADRAESREIMVEDKEEAYFQVKETHRGVASENTEAEIIEEETDRSPSSTEVEHNDRELEKWNYGK